MKILNPKFYILNSNSKGFTIIEMLVIIGTLSLISAILIINIRSGGQQVILFREQAKILSILSKAKSLGVATFGKTGVPCGYGVHFEAPSTFLIFKDLAGDCQVSDKRYSGGAEIYEAFQLDPVLKFDTLTLSDVIFIPPDPSVVITPSQDEATVVIKVIKSGTSATIKINSAGQIST